MQTKKCPACGVPFQQLTASSTAIVCLGCGKKYTIKAKPEKSPQPFDDLPSPVELGTLLPPVPEAPVAYYSPQIKSAPKSEIKPAKSKVMGKKIQTGLQGHFAVSIILGTIAVVFLFCIGLYLLWPRDVKLAEESFEGLNRFPVIPWSVPYGGIDIDLKNRDVSIGPQTTWTIPGNRGYLKIGERNEVYRISTDTNTGIAQGEPKRLQGDGYVLTKSTGQGYLVCTASPTGSVALYSNKQQIDVFSEDSANPSSIPLQIAGVIPWMEWSADGLLLLIESGKLQAWNVVEKKRMWEASDKLQAIAAISPARNWVIASVESKYLEVLDTKTGECIGRFGGEGAWRKLAVSPDGKQIVGARIPNLIGGQLNQASSELHEWDAMTAKTLSISRQPHALFEGDLAFMGPSLLSVGRYRVDLKKHTQTNGPDFPKGELVLQRGSVIKIESDCENTSVSRQAISFLSKGLAQEGFMIGDGGWTLKVVGKSMDSGQHLVGSFSSAKVPVVKGEINLIAPDGTTVHQRVLSQVVAIGKFHTKSRIDGGTNTKTESYDFGSSNPDKAMEEEVWRQYLELTLWSDWPRTVWKTDTGYWPNNIK